MPQMRASVVACLLATVGAWQAPVAVRAPMKAMPRMVAAAAKQPAPLAQLKETAISALKAGVTTALALSRPAKIALAAAALLAVCLVITESKKRAQLIEAGDACMTTGDEGQCEVYDSGIQKTPVWKLRMAIGKLAQTNLLADKLSGPPPSGFNWGKTY
jgi:hypothetical protein